MTVYSAMSGGEGTALGALATEMLGHARGFGLDPFDTIFEVVDYDRLNAIAAYGGFPTRYPHWRFGMEYDRLSKSHEYGLSKIYEMVINTDPAYAYLLAGNRWVDQKIVMAHVYGHVDFFKHNHAFAHTDRRMVDRMANHATRVRRIIDRVGVEKVETFIDTCLSVDNLIDPHADFISRPTDDAGDGEVLPRHVPADRLQTERGYMESYINPPEVMARQREQKLAELEARKARFPRRPRADVLAFLLEHAPLEEWEREVLHIVRAEAVYFAPQGATKIMNEGWASYWHARILTERALDASELIDFADAHSGVLATAPGQLNPYKLGIELWRDIEERWDRGMFGAEWDACTALDAREAWDKQLGRGQEKIFEVRRHYSDVTFIDEFLTPDFVERQRMYTLGYDARAGQWRISSREFEQVKRQLLDQITNGGHPRIRVIDANYHNRGELLLRHQDLGTALRMDYAREVLMSLQRLWKRPVHLETRVDEATTRIGFDGTDSTNETWDGPGDEV